MLEPRVMLSGDGLPLGGGAPTYNNSEPAQEMCSGCEEESVVLGDSQDAAAYSVHLHNGGSHVCTTDLHVTGRGLDWSFNRSYRSDVDFDGPLGHNWDFTDNRRLWVTTALNVSDVQQTFPQALPGDVVRLDGRNRADLYVWDGAGFASPNGYYTRLAAHPDGSYTERFADGTIVDYLPPDPATDIAPIARHADRNGNEMVYVYNVLGQLETVFDTLGRPISYVYDVNGRVSGVMDFTGRGLTFDYDGNGDLVSVTSPAVIGTPTGNDFPFGTTTEYAYSSGFADPALNHDLLTITAPNEVAAGGPPRLELLYETDPSSPNVGRVMYAFHGGINDSGVPAGGAITYSYVDLGPAPPGDFHTAVSLTTVMDRNGNLAEYEFNQQGNIVDVREFMNRGVRPGDPAFFETRYAWSRDYELLGIQHPEGNQTVYLYDGANADRFQQGNLLAEKLLADPQRSGDQLELLGTYTYEPIYNQLRTETDPRGNDPGHVPPNGGPNAPGRYTTTYTFDYQEGTDYVGLAEMLGVDPVQVMVLLADAGVPMGLGDVNGDGRTDQIAGNVIRIEHPTVGLLEDSEQALVEGDPFQEIVELFSYNDFGQMTSHTDPEENVALYDYYPETDPNGDGLIDNPVGDPLTGGYLKRTTQDASSAPGRNSGTNPVPTMIRTQYGYDPVGNVIREVDGRGIATDYVVNELDQVVQITRASQHNVYAPDPPEALPLTDFGYVERFWYDHNGNTVLQQVEDRGNTSGVDGNPDITELPWTAPDPDPLGGPAFVDTVYRYDILDNRVATVEEVSNDGLPRSVRTDVRYDPNENEVLTIQPEGNAQYRIFDERDLVFRTGRGVKMAPPLALLGLNDPTDYDVRGGGMCGHCVTYRYDGNGNIIETGDGDDTDLSAANNTDMGPGDRTRYVYDGFDRLTSVVDSVGNQSVYQYDAAGNYVRASRFGPVGGTSPLDDGPPVLPGPVSILGELQPPNLVNPNLLASTEYQYDELSRTYQADRVLFVNSTPTIRLPDVADGAADLGKGDLTPGDNQPIPGLTGVVIEGRVSTRSEYDRNSRRTFLVEDDGDVYATMCDGAGRTIVSVDPEGNLMETAYDDNHNIIEIQQTDSAPSGLAAPEIFVNTYTYDGLDRRIRDTDNIGHTYYHRYDSRGNLVATADASGPMTGATVTRRAFAGGSKTVNAINDFGNVTTYEYDGLDRLIRTDTILTASGQGDGVNIGATAEGVKTATPAPDPAQGGGDGIIRQGYVYDDNSLLSAQVDDQGNVTLYLYDDLNRRVAETGGLTVLANPLDKERILGTRNIPTPLAGNVDDPPVIPAWQIDDQLAKAQDRLTAISAMFPALADRLDDTFPTTVVYGYAPDDNVLILEDENDTETFTRYDAVNRPIAVRVFRAGQSDNHAGDPIFAPAPGSDPANPSRRLIGDANLDGVVGIADLAALADHYGRHLATRTWRSHDVVTSAGLPQAFVENETAMPALTAELEFYESADDGGVAMGTPLATFTAGPHPEHDPQDPGKPNHNHVEDFWANGSGVLLYPYAGKSTVDRGADAGEGNTPGPLGVRDLQLHPPNNDHLVVAAFVAPASGLYRVSDLGVRRVDDRWGDVTYSVFDDAGGLVAALDCDVNQIWVTDPYTYDLGELSAGDRIYFAVDRDGAYYYDAT
ncbi:MAG: DUF6531 domain-containing protein, partial [Planctomycetota bacterium]